MRKLLFIAALSLLVAACAQDEVVNSGKAVIERTCKGSRNCNVFDTTTEQR